MNSVPRCYTRAIVVCCAAAFAGAFLSAAAQQDEALVLRHLLGIKTDDYWKVGPSGERFYDSLADYTAWSEAYVRARAQAARDGDEGLRLFLFMAFAAHAQNDAALSESLSSDVYPIFSRRRADVLRVLRDLPFLVRPTCHYVAAFHGFEDRNAAGRSTALAEAASAAAAGLPRASADACREELRR